MFGEVGKYYTVIDPYVISIYRFEGIVQGSILTYYYSYGSLNSNELNYDLIVF